MLPSPAPRRLQPVSWLLVLLVLSVAATAQEPAAPNGSREFTAEKNLLLFPIKSGAARRGVRVVVEGNVVRQFDIELADAEPEWWSPLDITAWQGQKLTVQIDGLPGGSRGLELLEQADSAKGTEELYREKLRPQFHFTARRGWLNDPNGMVFYDGQFHMFFQHDPFGWQGNGSKHWGHADSRDLVHWEEIDEALYPDALGAMWSGSAVVDWKNTSGFGRDGQPPIVLIYTAAGRRFTQCIASTTDGRKVTKYDGNPVVEQITHGNRDPRVFWHEPTQRWVTALYVDLGGRHTTHFLTSPNLREWSVASVAEGGEGDDRFMFECPDFFELPVDGDPQNKKWVITAANSDYALGSFDGKTFTQETSVLKGHYGRGFYAAQTFSDVPESDGRRIQIGWLRTDTPGMPFNQSMSLPLELTLRTTSEGVRLCSAPVKELEKLRAHSHRHGPMKFTAGDANLLAGVAGELIELRAEFEPGDANVLTFNIRGVPILYDLRKQELLVNGHRAAAPFQNGKQKLIIYADRTSIEIFASDGLTYLPMPITLDPSNQTVEVSVTGGAVPMHSLEVHELKSAWKTNEEQQ